MLATRSQPRYQTLADALLADIEGGAHPIGSTLPTEHDLCRIHKVSRHTAREALRILLELGLIERRRGVGTLVVRTTKSLAFVQPIDGIDDLMTYAREAQLDILSYGEGQLDAKRAAEFGAPPRWKHKTLEGVRALPNQPPFALTQIHIDAALAPSRPQLKALRGAITEWIQGEHSVATDNIKQSISAVTLDADMSKRLGALTGSAGLRTVRRYFASGGKLFVVSDSVHAADRFSYEMTVKRDKPAS